MIYTIGPDAGECSECDVRSNYSENYFVIRQAINVILSLIVLVVAFKLPYQVIRKFSKVVMFGVGIVGAPSDFGGGRE